MIAEVFLSIFLAWFFRYITVTYLKRRKLPPGPLPYPFLGNIPQIMSTNSKTPFKHLAEKYGDIFTLSLPHLDAVVLSTDALIREARVERKDDLAGKSPESIFPIYEFAEGGVFSTDFSPLYRFRRKTIVSAMQMFGSHREKIQQRSQNAVSIAIAGIDAQQGKSFSPKSLLGSATIVNFWEWLTSKKLTWNDPIIPKIVELGELIIKQAYVSTLYQLLPFLKYFPTQLSRDIKRAKELRKELFSTELNAHIETYSPDVVRDITDSFISSYESEVAHGSENNVGSKTDLAGLMMDVTFGAYETTATSLAWFLLFMVRNPNIQEKLHEELDLVVGRDRIPSSEDAKMMPYLQATICESQRRSAMMSSTGTTAIRDTKIAGYHIPKGTFVMLNLSRMHLDERAWPEPLKFNPERFLDSDEKFVGWNTLPSFLQFGIGRRECLGQPMAKIMLFTFISRLFHRYKFRLPEGAEIPAAEPAFSAIILPPKDFKIVAEERISFSN